MDQPVNGHASIAELNESEMTKNVGNSFESPKNCFVRRGLESITNVAYVHLSSKFSERRVMETVKFQDSHLSRERTPVGRHK